MRIGVNTLFMIPGDVGGTEVYLRNTLIAMAALQTDDVLVLFTNSENDDLLRKDLADYPSVEFHRVPCKACIRPLRIIVEQVLLAFIAKKNNVDVLWSPGYTAPTFCFSPQAVTIHDLQYKSYPEDLTCVERTTLDVLIRCACKRCDAIITISEFSRREVIEYNPSTTEKTFAILHGVDSEFSNSDSCDIVEDPVAILLKLGVTQPFFLCVAHTYPHKNVDKLVDAFRLLEETLTHQLVLVGKARRGEDAVLESLTKIKDANRIVRHSYLSSVELQTLFRQAEIFILPSSYEGFGLPVLEAMMAGTLVIAPKMASLPEVGGQCAFYVDSPEPASLAHKISYVLNLPEQQKKVHIATAQKWATGFTWENTAQQTINVLKSIAKKS